MDELEVVYLRSIYIWRPSLSLWVLFLNPFHSLAPPNIVMVSLLAFSIPSRVTDKVTALWRPFPAQGPELAPETGCVLVESTQRWTVAQDVPLWIHAQSTVCHCLHSAANTDHLYWANIHWKMPSVLPNVFICESIQHLYHLKNRENQQW